MKEILIATQNPGKIELFKQLLSELDIEIIFPEKKIKVIEDRKTIRANSLKKAKNYRDEYNCFVLGDDASVHFNALNGAPGVEARRWMGKFDENVDDNTWLKHVLSELKKSKKDNTGYFKACWTIFSKNNPNKFYLHEFKIPFEITLNPIVPFVKGFPVSALQLDPITKKPYMNKTIKHRCDDIRYEFHQFIRKVIEEEKEDLLIRS